MRVARSLLLALALVASGSARAADDTHAVRLSRPTKVGDRYRVDAKGKLVMQQRVAAAGQVAQSNETTIEVQLLAVATVLAVDSKAMATRVSYQVASCQRLKDGQTKEIVPRGRTVVAEHKGQKTGFTVDGEAAPAEVAEALGVVISAHEPESATDDDIFGTRDRKRVGEKWDINAPAAARDLSARGLKLAPQDIAGHAKLEAVRTVDGVKALEVSARLRVDRLNAPLPPGMQLDKATIEAAYMGLFPADPQSTRRLADKMHMRVAIAMRAKKPGTNEEVLVEAVMEQTAQAKYAPAGD